MSLAKYLLDHDDISYVVEGNTVKKINYNGTNNFAYTEAKLNNFTKITDRCDLLKKDYKDHIDYRITFDELNFINREEAIKVLNEVALKFSEVKYIRTNRVPWTRNINITNDIKIDDENLLKIEKEYKENNVEIISKKKVYNKKKKTFQMKYDLIKNYYNESNMNDTIISVHTKSKNEIDNIEDYYEVKPHIHIAFHKNKNDKFWGKNGYVLKKEISQVLGKFGLSASINCEIKRSEKEYYYYKELKKRISNFSWVVAKHKNPIYAKMQLSKYKDNDKYVSMNNIDNKTNEYIELGGSYDFARKLKQNMKNKFNYNLDLKVPKEYKKVQDLYNKKDYEGIINNYVNDILSEGKISEKYKEIGKELRVKSDLGEKEIFLTKALIGITKNSGFIITNDYKKVYKNNELNRIRNKYIFKIKEIDKEKNIENFKEDLKEKLYLNQEEIREDMKKYKIKDLKNIVGKSEFKILFDNNRRYISENIKLKEIGNNKIEIKNNLLSQINKLEDVSISDNWKENIIEELYFLNKDIMISKEIKIVYKKNDILIEEKLNKEMIEMSVLLAERNEVKKQLNTYNDMLGKRKVLELEEKKLDMKIGAINNNLYQFRPKEEEKRGIFKIFRKDKNSSENFIKEIDKLVELNEKRSLISQEIRQFKSEKDIKIEINKVQKDLDKNDKQRKLEKINLLEKDLDTINSDIDNKQKTIIELLSDNQKEIVEKEFNQLNELYKERENIKTQIDAIGDKKLIEKEIFSLGSDFIKIDKNILKGNEKIVKNNEKILEFENKEKKNYIDQNGNGVADSDEKLVNNSEKVFNLNEKKIKFEKILFQLENELKDTEKEIYSYVELEKTIDKLTGDLDKSEKDINNFNKEKENLNKTIDAKTKEVNELKNKIADKKKEIGKKDIQKLKNKKLNIISGIKNIKAEISKLSKALLEITDDRELNKSLEKINTIKLNKGRER